MSSDFALSSNKNLNFIAIIIFLLQKTCCSISSPIFNDSSNPNRNIFYEEIGNAIELLEEIGLSNLCHPETNAYEPVLPLCAINNANNLLQLPHSSLRGSEWRNLEEELEPLTKQEIVFNSFFAILCVVSAAIAAGLTMGMLSIEPFDLQVKIRTATCEKEREQASSLIGIVEKRHRLLVTLLLLNSLANEALPIFLDKLVPSAVAIILSVTIVLFFGEIIPSAVFTGPNQMQIASMFVPFVKFLMIIFTPLAKPIAHLLDIILGHDDKNYDRNELSALVRVNYELRRAQSHSERSKTKSMRINAHKPGKKKSNLKSERSFVLDEIIMVEGALHMKTKTAKMIMRPLNKVFALPDDLILNKDAMLKVYCSGYSRIPIFKKQKMHSCHKSHKGTTVNKDGVDISAIVGILLSKQLMVVEPHEKRKVSTMPLQQPLCVSPAMNLVDLLNEFQVGRPNFKGGHLAVVCENPDIASEALSNGSPIPKEAGIVGITTLEDVIEELLQEEIVDEYDYKSNEELRISRKVINHWRKFVAKKKLKKGKMIKSTVLSFKTLADTMKELKLEADLKRGEITEESNGNTFNDEEKPLLDIDEKATLKSYQ